jgi:cytochrome c-type biogenesis protein CcmH
MKLLFCYNTFAGKIRFFSIVLFFCLLGSTAELSAQVDTFEFETDEQQQRFRQLSNELRCPMCQNTNLTGSTGGVAEDLRREIHRMIMAGMTDQDIEQFMFERYGDFIFYRPRLRAETVLLWFGPLLFLIIGGFVAHGIWRRAKTISVSDVALDEKQQARLKELLGNEQQS